MRASIRRWPPWLAIGALAFMALGAAAQERIVGLPCEDCEGALVGKPTDIATIARIAPAGEKGQPLQLRGRVVDADGKPAAGIVVYGYHTDASGHYPGDAQLRGTPARQHGRLHRTGPRRCRAARVPAAAQTYRGSVSAALSRR